MNLPNKLSVARVLCIPAIIALLYCSSPVCRYIAAGLFVIGCLTDYLDGQIARKHNLVTDFGKFIDPVADKLLVLTTMIMLIHLGKMPAWIVIIILCRELAVDGLRMVAVLILKLSLLIKKMPIKSVKDLTKIVMLNTLAIL